jgi:transcriptional regulator with XRE-family HTH domain
MGMTGDYDSSAPDAGPRSAAAIGGRIEAARSFLGKTQTEFAQGISATQSACSGWETGDRPPGVRTANKLCDAYGLTLDYIFRGDTGGMTQRMSTFVTEYLKQRASA